MKHKNPPWDRKVHREAYVPLKGNIESEVLVIGGGINGILTSYLLSKNGFKVVLIEKEKLCYGATGLTTAFLTQIIDTNAKDLIKMFGEKAKLILESHGRAIDLIETIIKEEKIDCEYMRCSNFIYANSKEDLKDLTEENENLRKLGVNSVFSSSPKEGFENAGYLEVKNQAKFHPLKFALTLAEKSKEHGTKIFEKTEAEEIVKDGDWKITKTKNGEIRSKWVISCAYEPFGEPLNLFFKKGMYKSFVLEYELPKGIEEGIYEDTHNPYHYFRVDKGENFDRLIVGGEDHKILIPAKEEKQFSALESYADKLLPNIRKELVYKWSGPILEPGDALAFIGPSQDPHLLYSTAFSGNGMTYSGISAEIIKDIVSGKNNKYAEIYKTSRLLRLKATAIKVRDFTEEFVNGVLKNSITK